MKRILLLGAGGQLGQDLQEVFLTDLGYEVVPVGREELDMERPEMVGHFLKQQSFDVLINCSSYHRTDECEDYPLKSFTVNSIAVAELAKACNRQGRLLFHVSTDYVFSGQKDEPYLEADATGALNIYGISKAAGEQAVAAYHDKYFIFRVSSLFGKAGASGKGGNFVETMIRIAQEGKPISVVADQIMSPTHTLDIARAMKAFLDQDVQAYGTYHCCSTGSCSWYEFAVEILRQAGIPAEVSPVPAANYVTKAKRPAYSVLNNEKLQAVFKMPKWKTALTEYLTRKEYLR
ncbi:dTDP-4-dehydrorhamnose reductase [Paenibacillus chartarius]|uniref:dTDP-4-dehydrorhamnose reductase n=1 Tax=Paenibacillus chartarius TaxID=747481 RepID=A0ABV6DKQ7_9BACL